MPSRKIAVLGAGVAGLAASLLLARDGHDVLLVERDAIEESSAEGAFAWERRGVSHFLQPHAFIPRGRRELREHFADVYASLLDVGARDVDASRKLPGPLEPADDELQYVAVRRPLIEWALRKAVRTEPGVRVMSGRSVCGIRLEAGGVRGIDVDGESLNCEIVVDAMGRRSSTLGWLEQQGLRVPPQRRSECGVIYYSRYYQVRPRCELPDGPWLLGPRGDLGYMGYSTFPGDNGTFAAVLAVPTGVPDLKILAREGAFQAAIESIPMLTKWAAPEVSTPITPVLAMGGLQNTIHVPDDVLPAGLFPVSDALCHLDPVLAHGLSFALIHAWELVRALRAHEELTDAFSTYRSAVMPDLNERYELAGALDAQRLRFWTGAPTDLLDTEANYALFSVFAAGAVAMIDPEVFRVFVRRMGLLDSTRVLDENEGLRQRVGEQFRRLMAQPRPAAGPTRDEMLALAGAAMGS